MSPATIITVLVSGLVFLSAALVSLVRTHRDEVSTPPFSAEWLVRASAWGGAAAAAYVVAVVLRGPEHVPSIDLVVIPCLGAAAAAVEYLVRRRPWSTTALMVVVVLVAGLCAVL